MKKKRFSVEQIVVVKQAEVGVPVAEVIRKASISEQTFYRWKSKYAGFEVDQVRQLNLLKEENSRLKQLMAELTLDKTVLSAARERLNRLSPAEARRAVLEEGAVGRHSA